MVGIDFFDVDVINTLIPIFSMHPDKEYLVYDKKDANSIEPITKAIKKRENQQIEVVAVPVDSDDFSDIEKALDNILQEEQNQSVYIDLTGGSELMNACGYKLGMQYNVQLLHVNFKNMKIFDIKKGEVIGSAADVTLSDYLEGIGAKRLIDSHHVPSEEEYPELKALAEVIFENIDAWKSLNKKIKARPKTYTDGIPKIPYKKNEEIIVQKLLKKGYLIDEKKRYKFRDEKAKEFIITLGIWLELYIYIIAKENFGDAELGVVIDWNNRDGREGKDNEIDVVLMYKSIPVFISCKMTKPSALDVSEVGFLSKRLAGQRGQAILATTEKIKEIGNEKTKGIHYRMKEMHVGCIETEEFYTKPDKEVMLEALHSIGL